MAPAGVASSNRSDRSAAGSQVVSTGKRPENPCGARVPRLPLGGSLDSCRWVQATGRCTSSGALRPGSPMASQRVASLTGCL